MIGRYYSKFHLPAPMTTRSEGSSSVILFWWGCDRPMFTNQLYGRYKTTIVRNLECALIALQLNCDTDGSTKFNCHYVKQCTWSNTTTGMSYQKRSPPVIPCPLSNSVSRKRLTSWMAEVSHGLQLVLHRKRRPSPLLFENHERLRLSGLPALKAYH